MHDIIIQAINEKKVVKFDYHGFDRVAEPHVYGTLNGIKSILTYQIRGGSKFQSEINFTQGNMIYDRQLFYSFYIFIKFY